jgi:DNA-directed RNA polymerase sigma subunit (sigma70/sigma32)
MLAYRNPRYRAMVRNNYYEEVARDQVYLTEAEEISLISQYTEQKAKLHLYVLDRKRCVTHFLKVYDEIRAAGTSIAKLSAETNTRKAGLNTMIDGRFDVQLKAARYVDAAVDTSCYLSTTLFDLNLSNEIYNEMLALCKPTKKLDAIRDELSRIEDTLLRSMLMAACEIAKRCSSTILSIDEKDAAQEAKIFLLESIRRYNPDYRTPKGERVKLCTYAYGRAERLVMEWVLTNSRLVRVPRSKMKRILIVVKAYEGLDSSDTNLFTVTKEANAIMKGRKTLTANNAFDIKEVDELIKILTSNYIRLDQPFNRKSSTGPLTIGDMISNEEPSAADVLEAADNKELLLDAMQDYLTKLELQIITLRYFHDPLGDVPKALTEIGPLLVSVYGGVSYSRETIRKFEKIALDKLKAVEEVQELWSL